MAKGAMHSSQPQLTGLKLEGHDSREQRRIHIKESFTAPPTNSLRPAHLRIAFVPAHKEQSGQGVYFMETREAVRFIVLDF